jgi:hypothetical protein
MKALLAALAFLVFALPVPVVATAFYVPDDHARIQDAIDGCTDGDTVIVRDGTYTGTGNKDLDFAHGLPLGTRAITVRSENGPENCIIDCEDSGRGFHFHSNETLASVVDGFTIRNGASPDWAGAILFEVGGGTIRDCIFTGNRTTTGWAGGAILVRLGEAHVINCTFSGNQANQGGGDSVL